MSEAAQEKLLREAGAQHIVTVRGSWRDLFKGVRVIRPGDTVYFVALVFVPGKRGGKEMPPAVQAAQFVHELVETKALGIEVYTGRKTNKKKDKDGMIADAANSLQRGHRRPPAGHKQRGRKGIEIKPEWEEMWRSPDYSTNEAALKAMGNPFGPERAYSLWGGSGRTPGGKRPKKSS